MKEHNELRPPQWATRLLSWYCKPELLEDLQGDLNEYFQRNIKSNGTRKARFIYVIDVFKFFRLYTVRKPEFINLLINWIMIGSYIKTSGRNIVRNKFFSTINIAGLAISMSVGLIMIGVLTDIFSYDKFHRNHENIYRINSLYDVHQDNNNFNATLATTSPRAGKAIKQDFTNVDHVAILRNGFSDIIRTDDKSIPLSGLYANEDFFKVFSFQMIEGNPSSALKEPFSIVMTEKSALKLFNSIDVLGKTVSFKNEKQYTITGVVKDVPIFSHMKFDLLGSLSTLDVEQSDNKSELAWDNIWNTYVYVLLPAKANKEAFKSTLEKLSEKENLSLKNVKVGLTIEPLDGIMYSNNIGNQIGQVMGSSSLWIFGALTAVVILSACFNYTNLSIARSIRRSREVGVRKVIGASRKHIISQFVVEALIISLVSFLFALILFIFLKPYFLSLEPSLGQILKLSLSFKLIVFFISFSILIGVLAGCFPAFLFAKMNAIQVLKDQLSNGFVGKLLLRKGLIVFQYCISIIFITFSIVIYQQYKHYVAFDLGYKTKNILNVSIQGNKADVLKEEFGKLPEVRAISKSLMVTSIGDSWITAMKYANPDDSIGVGYNKIDENYLPLHEHKLIAGTNFSYKPEGALETEIIVNQEVLKRFDIAKRDPQKAIGEIVKVDGKDLRIIGVMKDFPYIRANARNSQKEVVFRYLTENAPILNIQIQSSDWVATMEKLEAIWKKHDSVNPFRAKFYEEQVEENYAGLKASVKMAGFLAFLAICIASIGLLGMVVFTTEIRLKEISIRKVLGASEGTLLFLLGKGFFLLLAIATGISMPISILFFEKVAFPELANHAPLSIPEMFLGVLGVLAVALIMIGSQTLKIARANPAEVLKTE